MSTTACAQALHDRGAVAHAAKVMRSSPALKMIWGPTTMPDGSSAFPVYKSLKVDIFQIQAQWDQIAPTKPADATDPGDPAYHWNKELDDAVAAAPANGFEVAVMVRGTPRWANGGRAPKQEPDQPSEYATFLTAMTKRYPTIHHWMIWGEPTRPGNYAPFPANSPIGPRHYARLLDAAYGALKAASPANVVIGGMTWTVGLDTPQQFIHWLRLPNGKPPRMDMYGHNPFSRRFPKISQPVYYQGIRDINDTDTLHQDLRKVYGARTPPIWLSEFTVASDHPNRAFDFAVSRQQQARWVTAAFKLANSERYIAGLGWYNLHDESPSLNKNPLTNGLMTASGRAKSAFTAFQRAP